MIDGLVPHCDISIVDALGGPQFCIKPSNIYMYTLNDLKFVDNVKEWYCVIIFLHIHFDPRAFCIWISTVAGQGRPIDALETKDTRASAGMLMLFFCFFHSIQFHYFRCYEYRYPWAGVRADETDNCFIFSHLILKWVLVGVHWS